MLIGKSKGVIFSFSLKVLQILNQNYDFIEFLELPNMIKVIRDKSFSGSNFFLVSRYRVLMFRKPKLESIML